MSVKCLPEDKLRHYEEVLKKEQQRTVELISGMSKDHREACENNGDSANYSLHQADQGSDTNSREKDVYLIECENKKLKSINLALRRVYDKSYGICEICGGYINEPRLKVLPYACQCIECKSKEERKSNHR
jgi:DnaK suppressor protein